MREVYGGRNGFFNMRNLLETSQKIYYGIPVNRIIRKVLAIIEYRTVNSSNKSAILRLLKKRFCLGICLYGYYYKVTTYYLINQRCSVVK